MNKINKMSKMSNPKMPKAKSEDGMKVSKSPKVGNKVMKRKENKKDC